jgi:hypothetical protein
MKGRTLATFSITELKFPLHKELNCVILLLHKIHCSDYEYEESNPRPEYAMWPLHGYQNYNT